MPAWPPVIDGGRRFELGHLDPFTLEVEIDGHVAFVHVTFGSHIFSSEKGDGVRIRRASEVRYFCRHRHATSFEVARFMREHFVDAHVRTYLSRDRQQFYTLDCGHVAIFLIIGRARIDSREIPCRVISAYDPSWNRHRLPRGKLYTVRTVLRRRLDDRPIPVR